MQYLCNKFMSIVILDYPKALLQIQALLLVCASRILVHSKFSFLRGRKKEEEEEERKIRRFSALCDSVIDDVLQVIKMHFGSVFGAL